MLLLCFGSLSVAYAADKAGNVNVLLFQTEVVKQLQLRSANAALRLCSGCADRRGPVALKLRVQGDEIVNDTGQVVRAVELDGQAELTTPGSHSATGAGRWKVRAEDGQLRVSVEISRERYVEAVLAAEASPTEPAESLKALAVTARSFAASTPERHPGGALCDSTHCQALRLRVVSAAIRDAVWSTSGETLWFAGRRVPAYFSQHCGGFTEGAAEAWGAGPFPWLTSHTDPWCARVPSQWRASLSEADVRRALADEGYKLRGEITGFAIIDRDRSGRVRQIRVTAGEPSFTVPAATLRFAVDRALGWNQVRSDRYQVQRIGDRIVFSGSGFGHGVGLCQAGAAQMAMAGKSYRDILRTYFPSTTVRVSSSDTGWTSTLVHGMQLRATTQDSRLERDAARAFDEARSRWGAPVTIKPTLTVYPSTEAFRQATGQPGWEVASTRGDQIAAQPTMVLLAHGGVVPVLRHEFLHSFVEAQSSAFTPLWLREGLVAALNGDNCAAVPRLSAAKIDAALQGKGSLVEAQQAHAAACSLVRQTITQRGLSATRAMLKSH